MVPCAQIHARGMQSTEKLPWRQVNIFFMMDKLIPFNNVMTHPQNSYGTKKLFIQTAASCPFSDIAHQHKRKENKRR